MYRMVVFSTWTCVDDRRTALPTGASMLLPCSSHVTRHNATLNQRLSSARQLLYTMMPVLLPMVTRSEVSMFSTVFDPWPSSVARTASLAERCWSAESIISNEAVLVVKQDRWLHSQDWRCIRYHGRLFVPDTFQTCSHDARHYSRAARLSEQKACRSFCYKVWHNTTRQLGTMLCLRAFKRVVNMHPFQTCHLINYVP